MRVNSFVLAAVGMLVLAQPAWSAIEFDQDVRPDVIFGSGNANGGFTTDRRNNVELGLRAKVRFPTPANTFNSNSDGTYNHLAGNDSGRPLWSFEWTVNVDYDGLTSRDLDDLTYLLSIDTDPSSATSFTTFDPINQPYADHAIGTNATLNGGGTVAAFGDTVGYAALLAGNNVAQNSWRMDFFFPALGPSFDPNAIGTYDFLFQAFDGSTELASTSMQVNVIPEPTAVITWFGSCQFSHEGEYSS